jgi:hypothetical protein
MLTQSVCRLPVFQTEVLSNRIKQGFDEEGRGKACSFSCQLYRFKSFTSQLTNWVIKSRDLETGRPTLLKQNPGIGPSS